MAEAQAAELLQELVWDTTAPPVTDPVSGLQSLTGRLTHAADVLGSRLSTEDLDGATSRAWARVVRELRQALQAMESLGLAARQVELEEAQAAEVVGAVRLALEAADLSREQADAFLAAFLGALGRGPATSASSVVVAGEVTP